MATWSTASTRNILITGTNDNDRAKAILAFIDQYLVGTAGWTRIGSSDGTTWSWDATKNLPNVGSHTTIGAMAWGCYEQAGGGAQIVIVYPSTSLERTYMYWSGSGGFVSTSVDATTPPSNNGSEPADMISHNGSVVQWGQNSDQYLSMAYTTDGKSFILFGRTATIDYGSGGFITLENIKSGDTAGFWGFWKASQGSNIWSEADLSQGTDPLFMASYHPTAGSKVYSLMQSRFSAGLIFDNIGVDPITGNHQRMELWVGCNQATAYHIRGTCPGIYRVSSTLSSGDRLDDAGGGVYDYIVMGDYAVPWGSSDNLQW